MGTNAITDVLTAPQLVTLAVVLVFILPIGIFMQRRWNAWHDRTYELYGLIEKALGTHFTYDRTGKLADLLLKGEDAWRSQN